MSKYKYILAKVYVSNRSEEDIMIKKVKNIVPWIYVISDLNREEIVATFYGKKFQKANQKEFRIEKVTNEKTINCMLNGKATIILLTVG